MIRYPAKIRYSRSDRCHLVEFPDLPGCVTYGDTLAHAKENAREALTGYLESLDLRKIDVPKPSRISGKRVFPIGPEKRVAFALWLKIRRAERGWSQKEMARMLNIRYQSYQKYENPKRTNPTLKTMEKMESLLGERVLDL